MLREEEEFGEEGMSLKGSLKLYNHLLTSRELPMASPGVYPNIFTAPELQYTISPTLLAHTIAS